MAKDLAYEDARFRGLGFSRTHPDGVVEHLPSDQITIHTQTASVAFARVATELERGKRAYICGYETDKGKPGRCTPGDAHCNNYCNMAPEKGSMQSVPVQYDYTKSVEDEVAHLKKELERAYRAIYGFHNAWVKHERFGDIPVAYHSCTIAAAARSVKEHSLEGADYFVGKHVSVLQEALEHYFR